MTLLWAPPRKLAVALFQTSEKEVVTVEESLRATP
jgi:hypothetical protein